MVDFLVHIHVFYEEMWQELKEHLTCLNSHSSEIWITVPNGSMIQEPHLLQDFPGAHILHVDNRGYDIAPFVEVLKRVDLSQFRYCIKLHTKRDMPAPAHVGCVDVSGSKWRHLLLSFLKKDNLARTLQAFENDEKLGMVGHHALICKKEPSDSRAWAQSLQWLRFQTNGGIPRPPKFVAGSMFICRAPLMAKYREILADAAFETPSREHPSTISHAAERLLGHIITAAGYDIRDAYTPASSKLFFRTKTAILYPLYQFLRFCYQKKHTRKGYTIIKICKVPVYRSRKTKIS